jgi:hypothetical protein
MTRGDHALLYFAYTCVRDLFIGGVIYLAKKIIRWWYFTCKKPENIICDGILHVNMFHYFKIPYFTCNVFTNFTYNEYIGPYFLSHIVLRFLPSDLSGVRSFFLTLHWVVSYEVSVPMTERNPRTAQPPHKINYENSRRNFGYVGHPLVKCDTALEFAQCAVKGSLSFWDPPVYVPI